MSRRFAGWMVLLAAPLLALGYGGWAVITMDDLPDYLQAGRPTTVSFMVRQHGRTPKGDLKPTLEARLGGARVTADAEAAGETGRYRASLVLSQPGDWTVTIHSGFMGSEITLPPVAVVKEGDARPVALSDEQRGRRLFVAKGCVTCHVHRAFQERSVAAGPELTDRKFSVEYLKNFLAHPETVRPGGDMPNLGLSRAEIVALSSFLSAPAQASR